MSEKMTIISLPGERGGLGLMDWGEKTPSEMIAQMRRQAVQKRRDADIIDSFRDEDFRVMVVLGPRVQKRLKTLQEGCSPAERMEATNANHNS